MANQNISALTMRDGWQTRRVFVTVKAYPNPSSQYGETVCVAGITEDGQWIRLYPIPYRYLEYDRQFPTYTWIKARMQKSSRDSRPESYKIDVDSIQVDNTVGTANHWHERRQLLNSLLAPSLENLHELNPLTGVSLGMIRPRKVTKLIISKTSPHWSADEIAKLQHLTLFDQQVDGTYQAMRTLEKVPYQIKYRFFCDDERCKGHNCRVISWEVMQSLRKWVKKYGDIWETKFRQRYEKEFLSTSIDLHFFMGTVHNYPNTWTIIGLFYPPAAPIVPNTLQPSLF